MFFTRRGLGFALPTVHVLLWTMNVCVGAPLPHRPRTAVDYPRTAIRSSTLPLSTRDNSNSTTPSNGTASLTPTIRDDMASVLKLIAPDAESRFVNINLPTAFGANDPVQSNKDLSQLVDRVFLPGQAKSGNQGWVNTYIQCLIDVANTLPSVDNQTVLINDYFDVMRALAPEQAKLVEAYTAAKNESTTNIGVQLSSGQLVDALTMRTVDEWAAGVFNGSGSSGESLSGFDAKDYKNYITLNASYTNILPKYNKLETANKIASEGWLLRQMINQSPAIFNLSMIISGDPSSSSAEYSAAWSATIINSTSVAVSNVTVGDNLENNLHDGTNSDTIYATSINSEAPSPTPTGTSTSPEQATKSSTATTLASAATPAMTTSGSARRSRIKRNIKLTGSRIQRRALAASNALLLAASASSNSTNDSGTNTVSHTKSASMGMKEASLPGMKEVASASNFAAESDIPSDVSFGPLSSTSTQTSVSSSSTSVTGVPNVNASDPLSSVPAVSLQTTSSLFAMSLQEGAWSNNRVEFLQFIADHHPETYVKYFGNGTAGDGSIGRHWTHIFLLVTVKANSSEIEESQVVGMVYDVLPGLTTPSASADLDSGDVDSGSVDKGYEGSTGDKGSNGSNGTAGQKKQGDNDDTSDTTSVGPNNGGTATSNDQASSNSDDDKKKDSGGDQSSGSSGSKRST
ncbi:hypothetical protein J3R30DRAFT_3694792 [Lentinula aciculospora]|uniref:Uncharacterized protein n=1 Tax=Lentinula aciculospora TaxID=153920 RepID=A0A9W9AUK1_9AGAR|nr:hypothetical protein J3R30DRAFT_3694792 [Lentinula aciculospora]